MEEIITIASLPLCSNILVNSLATGLFHYEVQFYLNMFFGSSIVCYDV